MENYCYNWNNYNHDITVPTIQQDVLAIQSGDDHYRPGDEVDNNNGLYLCIYISMCASFVRALKGYL